MSILTIEERNKIHLNIAKLLDQEEYEYQDEYISEIIDEWETNKAPLIEMFKKHPNYVEGEFMIAFDADYVRDINLRDVSNFISWIRDKTTNEPEYINAHITEQYHKDVDAGLYCYYHLPRCIYNVLGDSLWSQQFITDYMAEQLNNINPDFRCKEGMKTSRAMNKLCQYIGVDRHPYYQRKFAMFADAVNPLTITRHTVLSLNPLDYLRMSYGNSWVSCHHIGDRGCYSAGTMSYMMDSTSMIFYTVDATYDGNEYYWEPKMTRQVFCFGEDKLLQSRLYPARCDAESNKYTETRNIVQKIISDCIEQPNLWTLKRGCDHCGTFVDSTGVHYPDWRHVDSCTVSILKGSDNENRIPVGHYPICPNCGAHHRDNENISCCDAGGGKCEQCGYRTDVDNLYYVEGVGYCCEDCCTYCDCCGGNYLNEDCTWIPSEEQYVCNACLARNYIYCEHCHEYVHRDDVYCIEDTNEYVCERCIFDCDDFTECDECGAYFRRTYEIDGYNLCSDCVANYCSPCDSCGEIHFDYNLIEHKSGMICETCCERLEEEVEAEETKPLEEVA